MFAVVALTSIVPGGPVAADPQLPFGLGAGVSGIAGHGAGTHGLGLHPHSGHHHSRYHPYLGGAYRIPHAYDPYCYGQNHWNPYPYQYPYSYPYPAPLYLPAEQLFGPRAMQRFMGWDNWNRPQQNINIIVRDRTGDANKEKPPNIRATNQNSLALAWKFIGYGDAHFGNQKYSDAYSRYRKAVRAAPQLAQGYFRQGFALVAMGRYDLAARAMRRGLALDPDWARAEFHLGELYGDNELAKKAHLDAMADAAEKAPHDADLLFLLGVYLHFDAQRDRAAAFFRRAEQLGGAAPLGGFVERPQQNAQ